MVKGSNSLACQDELQTLRDKFLELDAIHCSFGLSLPKKPVGDFHGGSHFYIFAYLCFCVKSNVLLMLKIKVTR